MQLIQKLSKLLTASFIIVATFIVVSSSVVGAATPQELATLKTGDYSNFFNHVGVCPREGQPGREACVLSVANVYVSKHCTDTATRDACNQEWANGFLVWYNNQIAFGNYSEAEAEDKIGMSTISLACTNEGRSTPECYQPNKQQSCSSTPTSALCVVPNGAGGIAAAPGAAGSGTTDCGTFDDNAGDCDITSTIAAEDKCDVDVGSLDPSNCGIIRYLINFINILSGLVAIAVIGTIVVSGIQYSASAGDPNAAAAAKKKITNAIMALVAFVCMYGFLQWIVPGGVIR